MEAWYAGSKGADAVANVLFGDVNPSAKLPMTFPLSVADLPHTTVVQPPPTAKDIVAGFHTKLTKPTFDVHYDEGLKVGYKWYDAEKKPVLFPFGFGLSYTTYEYSDLKVNPGKETTVTFTVKNTGSRAGAEIAQVYAALPAEAGEPPKRLVGWSKVQLNPGRKQTSAGNRSIAVSVDLRRGRELLEVAAGQLQFHGWWFVAGPATDPDRPAFSSPGTSAYGESPAAGRAFPA